jgi:hypothetical protein
MVLMACCGFSIIQLLSFVEVDMSLYGHNVNIVEQWCMLKVILVPYVNQHKRLSVKMIDERETESI